MDERTPRLSTGIDGLDTVLAGGLLAQRAYLLRGSPGTGKTILGQNFLVAGDGTGLHVAFEEPLENVLANAANLGLDLEEAGVEVLDLSPDADFFTGDSGYELFEPDEVEGSAVRSAISDAVERVDPDRVYLDPISLLRHLSPDDYQFRKDAASLIQHLTNRGATVLFSTQPSAHAPDDDLQFLADGAVELDRSSKGRTVAVTKFRGSDYRSGEHTLRITDEGMMVHPKLVPGDHSREFEGEVLSTGVPEVDTLLGGGIERGTVTAVSGPSGVGKTTTGTQFAKEAASRGERTVLYTFEEDIATLRHRSEAIGIPVGRMMDQGDLEVREVEPMTVSPDEFATMVRTEVEEQDTRVVMIDGTAGYRLSLRRGDDDVVRELHALCRYLRNVGATVILIESTDSVTGEFRASPEHVSYLADNIVFMRYFEVDGEIRKAMGVLKKRASDFERTLREFRITDQGIVLGEPLTHLRGVLTGTPELVDRKDER